MPVLEILDEPRRLALRDIEDVVQHEDLPVDVGARTDPDHGHLERVPDGLPEFARHAFEQDDIGTRILELLRRSLHVLCLFRIPALHAKPADLVYRLGLQPEVRANRDVVTREMLDDINLTLPPSSLIIIAPPSCIMRTEFSSAWSGFA